MSEKRNDVVASAGPACGTGVCPLVRAAWRWRGAAVWAIVALVVGVMAWPMIKGTYYRSLGGAAPADGIAWRTDLGAALAEARASGRPVLVDVTAEWCPPCQVMKHEVWPDAGVRAAVERGYVPVLADVDTAAGREIGARYGASVIPTLLVLDGEGAVVRRGSFMSRRGMLDFLGEG